MLAPSGSLFPTLDEEGAKALLDVLTPKTGESSTPAATTTAPSAATTTPAATSTSTSITYDQFAAVDLRVGIVRTCERVPKKDKLLRLTVDIGEETPRNIVAGMALAFTPEQLVGRKVIVVANLAPRDFGKGLVSHGMLLATGSSEKLSLATVEGDEAPGAKLR